LGSKPDNQESEGIEFTEQEMRITTALDMVYGDSRLKTKGKRASLQIGNWLEDIHNLFQADQARLIQQDAIDIYGLRLLLQSDKLMETVIPDVQLANRILELKDILPDEAKERARTIIRQIANQLIEKLKPEMLFHIGGHIYSRQRQRNNRRNTPDWERTIIANLKHFQPDYNTIIPEKLITRKRLKKQIRSVCILLDQSYSMHDSVCHASIFACIFHQMKAIDTYFIPFSDTVTDLSNLLDDPVDIMFGVQLGGSTNISKAIRYAMQQVINPHECLLVIISDLDETDDSEALEELIPYIPSLFKKTIVLLALNNEGKGNWNEHFIQQFIQVGIPCVASTPEQFPQLIGEVISN
jgi:hypothetical protein